MERVLNADDLVQRIRESDPVSFKMVYQLYWRKLYNVAYYIVQSESEAEDILQDVFSSLWYRREHLNIHVSIENYLVKAVKYTSFFYLKLHSRQKALQYETHPSVNTVEDHVALKELERLVEKLLESLPFKTRQAFSLSRFEGLTYPQIAEIMDVSVKTVEYHISQALKKFSKGLAASIMLFLTQL